MLPAAWERLRGASRDARWTPSTTSGRTCPASASSSCARATKPLLPAPLFLAALRKLAEGGEVALDRTWVRRPGHEVKFSAEEERIWALVRPRLAGEPYRPPRVRDIAKAMGIDEGFVRRLMRMAARRGDVEEIAHDHFFARAVVEDMARIAIEVAAPVADGQVHGGRVPRPARQRPQGRDPDPGVLRPASPSSPCSCCSRGRPGSSGSTA